MNGMNKWMNELINGMNGSVDESNDGISSFTTLYNFVSISVFRSFNGTLDISKKTRIDPRHDPDAYKKVRDTANQILKKQRQRKKYAEGSKCGYVVMCGFVWLN